MGPGWLGEGFRVTDDMGRSTSDATTRGVRVEVLGDYLPQSSDPAQGLWSFVYHVTITNLGTEVVQLRSRHWVITNSYGVEGHVRGVGVVGNQPVLEPGQSFSYSSGCPLDTPVGTMHGSYQMVLENGREFEAEVAPITFAKPYELN